MPPKKPVASKTAAKPTAKAAAPAKKAQPQKKAAAPAPVVVTEAHETMGIKQLAGLLSPNVESAWYKSGKWPCLLDPSTTAATFLRYRDVNYLSALGAEDMSVERIRLALLGGLKCGKPMVIDMGENDLFSAITTFVNNVQEGLMDKILDKRILQYEEFKSLVKPTDGDEYGSSYFRGGNTDNFMFIVLGARDVPPPNGSDKMYYILLQ